jgi:predicted esterase
MPVDLDQLEIEVFTCHREGRYRDALALLDDAGDKAPEDAMARLAFWRACLLALEGAREEALAVLERAAEAGCWWHPEELADEDLAALRGDPRFDALTHASGRRFEAARSAPLPPVVRLGPDEEAGRTVVGLQSAASSPARAASLWAPLAEDGWRVLLPSAPHRLNSGDRLWLDLERGELDLEAAVEAVVPHVSARAAPLVLGGFAQGGAIALHLALTGVVPADAVVLVAATHRYLEVVDAAGEAAPEGLRALIVVGDGERHVAAARETADRLEGLGVDVRLDVRAGVGHVVPPGLPDQLPSLLAELTASPPP